MTCALVSHLETASEPRKALWEGVETAVLENTKLKKVAFNTFKSYEYDCMARNHGDKLNHPSLVMLTISYARIKVVLMIILF